MIAHQLPAFCLGFISHGVTNWSLIGPVLKCKLFELKVFLNIIIENQAWKGR